MHAVPQYTVLLSQQCKARCCLVGDTPWHPGMFLHFPAGRAGSAKSRLQSEAQRLLHIEDCNCRCQFWPGGLGLADAYSFAEAHPSTHCCVWRPLCSCESAWPGLMIRPDDQA